MEPRRRSGVGRCKQPKQMKPFNLFKKKTNLEQLSQEEFDVAVAVLAKDGTALEVEAVVAEMVKAGIGEKKAFELYLFVPTAFCRQLIPEAAYQDFYVDYYGPHKQVERKYRDNKLYVAIENFTKVYFAAAPKREAVLNVCWIDAGFKVINEALHNGSKIENLEFAPYYITR
jgi:hypothetical protein